jgi:hypothetical protein
MESGLNDPNLPTTSTISSIIEKSSIPEFKQEQSVKEGK